MVNEKVIVALDFTTKQQVEDLVIKLGTDLKYVKVGMQLFYSLGSEIIEYLLEKDLKIFLDLKVHDIPNTAQNACLNLAKLGVHLINVHSLGGFKMMNDVITMQNELIGINRPKVIAVTHLTSTSDQDLNQTLGVKGSIEDHVLKLAKLSQSAGLDGVVASALEAKVIRKSLGENFLIVTPGVRLNTANTHDQTRVATPRDAINFGASHIVVGREVTKAPSPSAAFNKILDSIS
ncbi:MAG: orotidine-5'-phosphate decarboxylase [Bacteriovoracaceae bacterium]|nr:orotidine-5'-phosphate decarboxylase [Bacteriovoracaceae bacterium]